MATIVKLLVGATLDWLVAQTPTFVAWLERRRAARAAAAKLRADEARIDEYLARHAGSTTPLPAVLQGDEQVLTPDGRWVDVATLPNYDAAQRYCWRRRPAP